MKRYFAIVVCLSFAAGAVYAATKEQKRLANCGVVMQEVLNIPDNLPKQVLARAECVIVFPSVLKLAFGMGKEYGRGAMVCRTGKEFNGPWGAPAMYALEGDSIGMQLGGEATDLILLIMNQKGVASILSSKVKLGGDASAAAGPKGRDASANTDAWLRAEILSYSRSRGLFAGISLEGSTLRPDNKANARIYGRKITARAILLGNKVAIPATGRHLVRVLQRNAPRNESKQVASK
ncbi:MAG TPA: lipid-binding SYLF domain-containing protein [Candidatus Dormibacteraeota bacterium]|nr:lipid-binding SYLF domain-containing protein [Candidatus Dormibacteraeota bacterium]